jgi:arylsulfatase A-like enzyme/Flp pilus assembly protein TadD
MKRDVSVGLTWWRIESVGRSPLGVHDRARRLGKPGQLTERDGQRPFASSQRGPATGHGFEAPRRQADVRAMPTSRGHFVRQHSSGLACAALTLCLIVACGGARRKPFVPDSLHGWNVLLVTIDTLRADHVGAYGNRLGLTPTLDRLAREGLRFTYAYSHVPLTLPSHTTIMTGTYPFTNGVHDNGSFRFDGKRPTLAGLLKGAGYRTGAFVGAFPVDARFGLNAGFDVYDDNYGSRSVGGELSVLERPAEQVLAVASNWIAASPSSNPAPGSPNPLAWFAWVHLYDPHDPYAPPEPFRSRFTSDLYSGEVAYADAALGATLDRLRSAGKLEHTIIAVMADHGESLGEHGERTHGLFAYDATIRVPLIIWAPPALAPAEIVSPVRLIDVMPTLVDLVGVHPPQTDGRSLRPLLDADTPANAPASYFEALSANLTRNWAPLTGVVRNGLKLIDLPIPELYDLTKDPSEQRNLYARRPDDDKTLERELDALTSGAAAPRAAPVDRETEQRLRSLGYIVAPADKPKRTYTSRDDPKSLVPLQNRLDAALDALKTGDAKQSEAMLRALIQEREDFTIAHERLAFVLRETGRLDAAIEVLERASRMREPDAELLATLGGYLQEANQLQRSLSVLEAAVKLNPSEIDAHEKLAVTYTRLGRFADAEREFRFVLSVDPGSPMTYNNLGSMFLAQNRTTDAIDALSRAVALDPGLANAHNGLGVAYARKGDLGRAAAEWQKALELRPDLADARENLDRVRR